ncbi:hypothetical protein N825_37070 [Skermanella stibiiresistens SB22]|uniref:Uncharacterized protein n=1 Tax=Skermanella stibiiresistens SB22 TaxID=1385369 RepID=W9H6A6_9PROT|nr:hypothetical protein [Skermanella stibiiresistens]EWY40326.1 hypothetical protein N825_37070 [Skermanella stibiiresistens SB22]
MVKNRQFSYETLVCHEGRWLIHCIVPEEEDAVAIGRRLLTEPGNEEIKVVRNRTMLTGFTTKREILHEVRPAIKEKAMVIKGRVDRSVVCEEVDDIYALQSRLIMGRLFRLFLEKYQITATELLHNWTYLRKLSDAGNMLHAAVHQVALAQAAELNIPAKERIHHIEGLVHQAMARARDFYAERRHLPRFDTANLDHVSRRVHARCGPENHVFTMRCLLGQHLMGYGSVGGKMEMLLTLMTEDLDPVLGALFEGVVADALVTTDMIKDLIGPQANLAQSLCSLADFLHGRGDVKRMTPNLARIGALIERGAGESCRLILVERLLAELKRDHPLDRKCPEADGALLDSVIEHLRGPSDELLGGEAAEAAIADRLVRQRQAFLRDLGMVEVADQLPGKWKPNVN